MVIDVGDITSVTVNLNDKQTGDSCNLVLANKDNKYDELIQWDNRYAKSYAIQMGFGGTNVTVFTGRVFISDKEKSAGQNDTLNLTLLERNSVLENAPMLSERITNTTLKALITLCATKYFGYAGGEVLVVDPDDYFDSSFCSIAVFEVRNESLFKKLKELAAAFGGVLYNDADGNLVLRKLFTTVTPDITYEMNDWIKWSIKTNLRNEVPNEIEVIGREKQIDEICAQEGDNRSVLGYNRFNANSLPTVGLPFSSYRDSNSIQVLMSYKDSLYITGQDDSDPPRYLPGFLWDMGAMKTRQDKEGHWKTNDFVIMQIPFIEKWGIPTEIEVKHYIPGLKKTHAVNCEAWTPSTGVETMILGWNKESATVLVYDLPCNEETEQPLCRDYLVIVYGYAAPDKYVAKKSQVRFKEIWQQTAYEDVKQPWVTNFYARKVLKDPVSGKRLSEYTGVIKKETVNLPWLDTVDQLNAAYDNVTNVAWMQTRPFTLVVPVNPLIERGDLVRVELDATYWCEFWVESITHEYSKSATTTLNGYIYQSQLPYDPPVTT
jgi:hypothetical protein